MENGGNVCHVGDEVGFTGDEGLDLREDGLVKGLLGLVKLGEMIEDLPCFEFVVEMGIGVGIEGEVLFLSAFFGGFIGIEASLPLGGKGDIFGSGEFGIFGGFFDGVRFDLGGLHEFAVGGCTFRPRSFMHFHRILVSLSVSVA